MLLRIKVGIMFFACSFSWVLSFGQEKTLVLQSGIFSSHKSVAFHSDIGWGNYVYSHNSVLVYALNPAIRLNYEKYFINAGVRRLTINSYETYYQRDYYWDETITDLQIHIDELNAEFFLGFNPKVFSKKNISCHLCFESFFSLNPVSFKFGNDTLNRGYGRWYDGILITEIGASIAPRLIYLYEALSFEFALLTRLTFYERYSYYRNGFNFTPPDVYYFKTSFYPQLNIGINLNYFKK